MSIGIAYNPCYNCKEMDKCSICELTYYRKGYIKSPSADVVEVRHGHWINKGDHLPDAINTHIVVQCSECGFCRYLQKYTGDYDGRVVFDQFKTTAHYCQYCGAKMDGERKDDGTETD